MNKNVKLGPLPKEDVSFPFESIRMDMSETFKKEIFLIIVNRYTNYTWVKKMGAGEGTSRQVIDALRDQLVTGLLLVKKIHQDNVPK